MMPKPSLVIIGVLALTFGAGVVVGFFLFDDPSRSDAGKATSTTGSTSGFFSDAAAQDREEKNTLLSTRIRELEKELTDANQNRRSALADRVAFFKKFRQQISIQPFGDGLKVTPEMEALLDLSPEEKQAVEQHLAETKAELDKLQDADTVLSKQTDTSVTYDIPANKQGAELKDRLHALLSSDIGQDRADIFMDDSYAYNSQLAGFLVDKRQIEISWTGENNQRMYTVRENTGTGSSTMTSNVVQPEYQKYLPEGMKP